MGGRIDWGPGESAGHGCGAAFVATTGNGDQRGRGQGEPGRDGRAEAGLTGKVVGWAEGGGLFGRGIMDESNEHAWQRFGRPTC